VLAERLGRTVRELEQVLTVAELAEWAAYDQWRAKQEEEAMVTARTAARLAARGG
jgi:hypothetical protein